MNHARHITVLDLVLLASLQFGCSTQPEPEHAHPSPEAQSHAAADASLAAPSRAVSEAALAAEAAQEAPVKPATEPAIARDGPADSLRGPFGLSRVTTPDEKPVAIDGFGLLDDCSTCHARQAEEFDGSFHSRSHHDPFYRAFAELARAEAGEATYAWCSGCHSPQSVVAGLVPGTPEAELPEKATAGVQCDVCHQIRALTGDAGPWKEPGNASFVLAPSKAKTSIRPEIQANPGHTVEHGAFLEKAELCASCHTVIHPTNGLRVEHTYDEWKNSVYAQNGVVCQDCHMRTVEQAIEVARTLKPVDVLGKTSEMSAKERSIHPHFFVGGNADAEHLTGSATHAAMAEARLKSAATLAIEAPEHASGELAFHVAVTNVGAGHALPTSLTELRQMWVELVVKDADGKELHRSGTLDAHGELAPKTLRFGSELLDASGKPTFKLWEAASFAWKRCIAPKATDREPFHVTLPPGTRGPLSIEAGLLFRSAPPHVVKAVMKDAAFTPRIVEMASASSSVALR
ncbi:MAG: hypothetical protein IPJ77_21760 [Planctomycetes bacterium]|nr:hypothetical protein [Planctomycetota bacterium]